MSGHDHRPHSRQVTGARCTGGRGSPVMSWILLKANNAQQASGVGDKDFSVLSEICSICEQPLYRIMLMILHTNKWCVLNSDQNLQIFFKSIWKIPSASGHSRSPFTSCRTRQSWYNGSSLDLHVLNGYGSVLPKLFIAPVRMPFRTSNTHNSYMITDFFTRPKHDFTRLGRVVR